MSTLGLLSLLHRWTLGGRVSLRTCRGPAELSRDLLAQFISACVGSTENAASWSIRIVFDMDWAPPWPNADPEVDGERVIRLGVDENGFVDLIQWHDAKNSLRPMAYESALHRCSDNDGRTCLPLLVVYHRLASVKIFDFCRCSSSTPSRSASRRC